MYRLTTISQSLFITQHSIASITDTDKLNKTILIFISLQMPQIATVPAVTMFWLQTDVQTTNWSYVLNDNSMSSIIIIILKGKLLIFKIYFTKGSSKKGTYLYDVRIWNNAQTDGLLNFYYHNKVVESRRIEIKMNLPSLG